MATNLSPRNHSIAVWEIKRERDKKIKMKRKSANARATQAPIRLLI